MQENFTKQADNRVDENMLENDKIINNVEKIIFNNEEDKKQATKTLFSFIKSYTFKQKYVNNEEWLVAQFKKYPTIWNNEEELLQSAHDIISTIAKNIQLEQSLEEHFRKGYSLNGWIGQQIEQGAKANNMDVSKYAQNFYTSFKKHNLDVGTKIFNLDDEESKHNESITQKDWNNSLDKMSMLKDIGKQSAIASGISVGITGVNLLGNRVLNFIKGEENKPIEEEVKHFVQEGLKKGASTGLITAISGGLTVISKQGLLGSVLKATPVGKIAHMAIVAVTGISTLIDCVKKKKSPLETVHAVAKLFLGNPDKNLISIGINKFVGEFVGEIAGKKIRKLIYQGAKTCVNGIAKGVKNTLSTGATMVQSVFSTVCSWF